MDSLPEGMPVSKIISFEDYGLYHEGVSGKKRGLNFNVDEDTLLVAAWLDPSLDASIGNCPKLSSYWKRIGNYYMQRKNSDWPRRSVSSLCHRWSNIQHSVKRFCYFLTKVGELNKTDALNELNIQAARIAFHSVTKQPFRFEHCWELLKNEQRWLDWCSKQATNKRKSDVQSSPLNLEYSNPESIDDVTDELHMISEEDNHGRGPRKKAAVGSNNLGKTLLSDDSTLSNTFLELENEDKEANEDKILKFGMFKSSPLNPECSNPESIDDVTDELHGTSEEDNDERTPRKKAAMGSKYLGKTLLSDDLTLSNVFLESEKKNKKSNEEKILKFNPTSDEAQVLEIQKAQLFVMKERNRIKSENLQLEFSRMKLHQSREDVLIMMTDTSAMDPEQKEYFRLRRMEILRRAASALV